MTIIPHSQVREVSGITEGEKDAIRNFLQGAVYCWCKNRKSEWFSLRDLMGGDNFHWEGTPLFALYRKHAQANGDAVKQAGIDGGWILKAVINVDAREFSTREANQIREYRWNDTQSLLMS